MKAQILSILNRYPGLSDEEVAAKAGLPADQVRAVRASADRRADLLRKMSSLSDEEIDRGLLVSVLEPLGFEVVQAASGEQAWELYQSARPDVVLLDLVLGDIDGLEILRRIKQDAPEAKVLLMSAYGSIESAVQAMKLGGYDFIKKPFDLEEIVVAVRNAVRTSNLESRIEYLAQKDRSRNDPAGFVYKSSAMQTVMSEVRLIAQSPVATVLVYGEKIGRAHV